MEDVDDDGGFHDEQEVIVDNNSLDVDQGPEDDEDGTEDAIATTTLQQQHQPKQHTVIHSDLDNDGHVHEQGDGDKENMNSSNADSHQNLNRHDDDDEEEECRVCRGVAEEGYVQLEFVVLPAYSPPPPSRHGSSFSPILSSLIMSKCRSTFHGLSSLLTPITQHTFMSFVLAS